MYMCTFKPPISIALSFLETKKARNGVFLYIYVADEKMRVELTVKDNLNKKRQINNSFYFTILFVYIIRNVFYTYTHTNTHAHTYIHRQTENTLTHTQIHRQTHTHIYTHTPKNIYVT